MKTPKTGIRAVAGFVLLLLLAGVCNQAQAAHNPTKVISTQGFIRTNGRYGGINIQKNVDAMKDLNVDALMYWITGKDTANRRRELEDLLKSNKLDIWVKINSWNLPYGRNHKAWAKYFAELSVKYPRLKAWSINDFVPEKHDFFKPESVQAFMDVKDAINPNLMFVPGLYSDVRKGLQYFEPGNVYKPILKDATMEFYWKTFTTQNPSLTLLADYTKKGGEIIPPAKFFSGLFLKSAGHCIKENDLEKLHHDPKRLKDMLQTIYDGSDGVILWGHPSCMLWLYDTLYLHQTTDLFKAKTNDDPSFDFMLGNAKDAGGRDGTFWGWYQEISASVALPPNITQASIDFKIKDNFRLDSNEVQYNWKQLLVNGKIVWEKSLADDAKETISIKQNLLSHLSGTKANIAIRVISKVPNHAGLKVYLGDITLRVNGNTINTSFKINSGIHNMDKWMKVYDTVRSVFWGGNPPPRTGITRPVFRGNEAQWPLQGTLRVYDMKGRLVANLFQRGMRPGYGNVRRDARVAANGVYIANAKIAGRSQGIRYIEAE